MVHMKKKILKNLFLNCKVKKKKKLKLNPSIHFYHDSVPLAENKADHLRTQFTTGVHRHPGVTLIRRANRLSKWHWAGRPAWPHGTFGPI